MMTKDFLSELDEKQRQAAEHLIGPLCVRAGAGTGKTRTMTYRIAHGVHQGVYHPYQVMALTFTTKAAAELSSRLQTLGVRGVRARTFHSAALGQLRHFWSYAMGGTPPEVMQYKGSLVAATLHRLGIATDKATIRDLSQEIEWSRVRLITAQDYPQQCEQLQRTIPAGLSPQTMSEVLQLYQQTKRERNVMDFEDVLAITLGMLIEHHDIARRVRDQYKHFVVDEYQDVSPLQQELLEAWLGPDNRNVCVVGDAAQTIYSFTGATSRYLTDFTQRYRGARVVELTTDYRSTPQIVGLANSLIAGAKRGDAELKTAVELTSACPDGPDVHFDSYRDDNEEAVKIAAHVKKLHAQHNIAYSQMAILYRTNVQSGPFEQALADQAIGCVVRGGERFFQRQEIRQALTLIRAAAGSVKAGATHSTPRYGLGEQVIDIVSSLGWSSAAPRTQGAVRERWDSLQALVELAKQREADGMTIVDFMNELQHRQESQAAPVVEGVTLSSLHAAKGLEWEVVFLAGCSQGLLPIKQAESPASINEERRLAYVGVTRAMRHLYISYAKSRHEGGAPRRQLSMFFNRHAPSSYRQKSNARSGTSPLSNRQKTKDFLSSAAPDVIEIFERLRQWRLAVSQELGRPAYTIVTDVSLRDIAQVKPKNLKQLGMIRGIGQAKIRDFGRDILALVRNENLDTCIYRSIEQVRNQEEHDDA